MNQKLNQIKMKKLKIDNRSTCLKLQNAFQSGSISTGNDVEEILRIHQWLHENNGIMKLQRLKSSDSYRNETVTLHYPNSKIVVDVAFIPKDECNNTWTIKWFGPNDKLKLTLNGY